MVPPNLETFHYNVMQTFHSKYFLILLGKKSRYCTRQQAILSQRIQNYKQNTTQIKNKRWLCNERSSERLSMAPTDGEMNINFMSLLFTHLSPVPVYGIAQVHRINNIVQNMHKVPKHHNQQHPCHCGHKVRVCP